MEKERESGIELLRIIAMLMVIGVHIFLYGGYFDRACEYEGIVASSAHFMKLFFRPAVNIFVIITGYFMIHMEYHGIDTLKKAYKRLLPMYGTLYFYSVVLGILFFMAKPLFIANYSDAMVVWKMFFPLSSQEWYFLTDYFLLCLFAPFFNIILHHIGKREYQFLLILASAVMSVWICLINILPFSDAIADYGYEGVVSGKNVFSFLYIYMLGGYIGKYTEMQEKPKVRYLLFILLCVWVNYFIWIKFDDVLDYSSVAISYANPFVVLSTVFFLLFFKDLYFHSGLINVLASATIGIYALHELEYMRNFIWDKFNFEKIDCSNLAINLLRIVSIMLFIFGAGAIIELTRQQLFKLIANIIKKKKIPVA